MVERVCLARYAIRASNLPRSGSVQQTSRQVVNFTLAQNADVIVLEDLKGWRPKAGKKRSGLRQRFHQWLHRRLATLIEQKMAEAGGRVVYVYARGTSSWAFDGSGRVKRNTKQYELATFTNGKQYNADLNASYNIGARYWAWKTKLTRCKDGQLPEGGSSPGKPRMPVTLSTLWQREPEARINAQHDAGEHSQEGHTLPLAKWRKPVRHRYPPALGPGRTPARYRCSRRPQATP